MTTALNLYTAFDEEARVQDQVRVGNVIVRVEGIRCIQLECSTEHLHEAEGGLLDLALDFADMWLSENTNNDACEWAVHYRSGFHNNDWEVVTVTILDEAT